MMVQEEAANDYGAPPAAEKWAQWNRVEDTGKADVSVSWSAGAHPDEQALVSPAAEEWAGLDQGEEVGPITASVARSDIDTTGGNVSVPPTAEEWAGLDQDEQEGQVAAARSDADAPAPAPSVALPDIGEWVALDQSEQAGPVTPGMEEWVLREPGKPAGPAAASVARSDTEATGGHATVSLTAEDWAALEDEQTGPVVVSADRLDAEVHGPGHALPLPGIKEWAAPDQSKPVESADTNAGWAGLDEDDDEAAAGESAAGETAAPIPWMTQPPAREGMLLMVSVVLLALAAGLAGVREMSERGGAWFSPGDENNAELTVAIPEDDAHHFVEESVLQADIAEFDQMLIEENLSVAAGDDASTTITAAALEGNASPDEADFNEWQPGPWLPLPESRAGVEAKTADPAADPTQALSHLMDIPSTDFDSNDLPWWHPVKLWHHVPSRSQPVSQPPVSDDIARIYGVLPVVTQSRTVRLPPAALLLRLPGCPYHDRPAGNACRCRGRVGGWAGVARYRNLITRRVGRAADGGQCLPVSLFA